MKKNRIICFCNSCKANRYHILKAEVETTDSVIDNEGDNPYEQVFSEDKNQIIQCERCDDVTFRVFGVNVLLESQGLDGTYEFFYPERQNKITRNINEKNLPVPDEINTVLNEVIKALNADMIISAQMGLTAVINGIIYDKDLNYNDYNKSIDEMLSRKMITKEDYKFLKSNIYVFHAGFKELSEFNKDFLLLCLDGVISIIQTIYEIPRLNKKIEEEIKKSFD
jgi:hypothetical protein